MISEEAAQLKTVVREQLAPGYTAGDDTWSAPGYNPD